MPRPRGRVGRQPVGQRDDERQAPGAQAPLERADVRAAPRSPGSGLPDQRPGRPARAPSRRLRRRGAHVVLHRTRPTAPGPVRPSPLRHWITLRRLARQGSGTVHVHEHPAVGAAKTERLLNLVICLLYTRRPLSKAKIRDAVPQYGRTASTEAFDRMFERDKDELRELGIPLVTEPLGRLLRRRAGLPDRRARVRPARRSPSSRTSWPCSGLASRAWAQASLAGPAAQALRKLHAAGVERDDASLIGIEPRLRTAEPAFEPVKTAVVDRRPIRFAYRTARSAEVAERHVQPWGIASWHGRWYLTGFDIDRGRAARLPAQPDRGRRASAAARPGRTTCRPTTSRAP